MKSDKAGVIRRNDRRSFVIALAVLFAATVVHAADCYWAGETSSAWETSGNWTTTARKPTNDGGYFRSDKFHNNFKSGSRAYLVTFSAAETNNWRTYFNNCGTASAPIVLRANDAASGLTGGDSTNKDAKNYEGIYIGTNQTGGNGGSTDGKASTGNAYVRFESGTYATRNTYSYFFLGNNSYDGNMTVAGATINASSDFKIFSGSLTIESGTVNVTSWTRFENNSRAKEINIGGGMLVTYYINSQGTSGSQTVVFNGGTLKKRSSSTYPIIHANIAVKVGAKGGTIDANGLDLTVAPAMNEDPSSPGGGMKFCGGGTVTLSGAVGWTGGTTIEGGTTVLVDTAAKKNALFGSGGSMLKFIPTATGTATLVTITGDGEFAENDLLKVVVAPDAAGTAEFSISEDGKSLLASCSYAGGAIDQSSPTLVFPGATLADLATHTLRARMQGANFDSDGVEATFFDRQETMDGDVLTKVTYQLQALDEHASNHYTKDAMVEFTAGESGVYAKLASPSYSSYGNQNQFGTIRTPSGTSGYIPYDLRLVKPVSNSINVNINPTGRSGAENQIDTTSSARYGAGDYAVPYTAWSNFDLANNQNTQSATIGGVVFTVSGQQGNYYCSNASTTKDVRHGYIDDSASKNSPTLTATGIPYEFYRIVVYMSTDTTNNKFNYVTINGRNYTASGDALSSYAVTTIEGASTWGKGNAGSGGYLYGLKEGLNYLVSPVLCDSTATVVGHNSSGARGNVAAIQIVEYAPTTYTATIADGGAKTFSTLDWDKTLPALLTGNDQIVINVNEDTTLTLDSAIDVYAIKFNVADGKTLTLAGANVAARFITATGAGQTVVGGASQLAGTVKGDGTLVYGASPSGIKLTDSTWTGVLWLKNGTMNGLLAQALANANSTLRLTGVTGYFNNADSEMTCAGTLELVDDGATPAFTVNNGFSANGKTVFAALKGDGTFKADTTTSQRYMFNEASGFTGTIDIPGGKNTHVILGNGASLNPANGTVTVVSGATATVAAGKTWTANGGMVLDGTLILGAGANAPKIAGGAGTIGVSAGTGTVNGFDPSAVLTLTTAADATLAIVDGSLAAMTVGALDNQGTIDLRGTALAEATFNLAADVSGVATGTILYPATFQKFVVMPADPSAHSLSAYSPPAGLPEGAGYYVTVAETREEFGKGTMTVTDCAAGVNVRVARPNGTFIDMTPVDGTVTLTEAPQIAGAATAFDATYTNTVAYAYKAPGWNPGDGQDVKPPTYNNTANDETTGMYILHHPWVSGVDAKMNALRDFTLVVVGTMSPSHSTQFLHMGNTGSGVTGILVTTTENDDEVLIAKNTGGTVDSANGVKASVPNAATSRHAYVINKRDSVFEVWVDGVKRGQFDVGDGFVLGTSSACGIQVGSDHGGNIRNAGIYKGVSNSPETETGVINVVRLFDYSITDAQAEAVFAAYPYVSQGGLYTRTVAAGGTFSETDAWSKDGDANLYDVPVGATVDDVYYNPSATLTASAAATLTVNADVSLDTFAVSGSAALKFAADGEHSVTVVGAATVNAPITDEYGAVNMSGAPVQLGSSGAICFDCSGFDISEVFTTTRFQLTGLIDRDDAKVTFVPPAAVLSRTVSFGYSTTGSCYEFTVTAERTAGTVYYKSGTYAEGSADLRIVTLDGDGNETETVLFPGDNVVFTDAVAGENAVVQFGETLPANVTFGFEDWTGKVVPVLPSSMYVWTGEAGDGKANTAGNWYGGVKPPVGAAVYIPSKTAAIDNDIAVFAPASITFGYGIGVVTIGGNAITGVVAVTNLSEATHTFECPVAFAERIFVSQRAKGWDSRAQSSVRFAGGVTGTTFADGTARFLNGAYSLSTAEDWVANTYSDDTRWGISQGSSLTVPSVDNTVELAIGQTDSVDGGAFTAGVVRTSGRICCWNNGEYVVTNELVFTLPGADRHVAYQHSDGAFKFEKITLADQGASKWFYFANEGNYNYTKNIWIGAGGLNFADGASANTAYSCGLRENDVVYLRPWHSDYTIRTKPNSTTDFVICQETHIGTDDESGVARTVTCDGLIHNTGAAIVEGSGTFVVNHPGNMHSGTWTINDTATVAVKPGSKTGTGAVTVNAGATFAVSESGTVAHGGALTLAAGAALGFNFTDKEAAPVLDLTDKTVAVNGAVKVKVSLAGGVKPMGGKYVLTSGGKFVDANVSAAADAPKWVKSVSVNDDGDIVLVVKPSGVAIFIR
ncbi:MAG: hypothetical protein IKL96_04045 [Kiritimatiellae bacterium]|nr:hypothetical protein [Kiritimatiellia bacterium]